MPIPLSNDFVQRLKSGDADGFNDLYELYGKKIYNLAYCMTGNQLDAEDITQETFMQAYSHIDSFRGDSQLYTWMYAITRNLCFRSFEKENRNSFTDFEKLIHRAASSEIPAGLTVNEKNYLIRQIKDGCLTGLLRCLSFNQRMAFILRILLHQSIPQIAYVLDKSQNATKVLIHRARINIKAFLCENCSLYKPGNPCRCEYMMQFSLKQGWIHLDESQKNGDQPDPGRIEQEIRYLREVTALYNSLQDALPAEPLKNQILSLIQEQSWSIFNPKKV